MMKLTSAEAAKLLKRMKGDYEDLLLQERLSREFIAATSENVEECRPAYHFAETQAQLADMAGEIRKLKHALNIFNTTTIVPGFDMTIDEMLVYIPQLNEQRSKFYSMKNRLQRQRMDHCQTDVIDYRYMNYDIAEAARAFAKAQAELTRAQLALDKVNTTVTFEFEM